MEHTLGVVVVLIAILQILLTISVIPTGLWIFRANRTIGEMTLLIERIITMMGAANGGGIGIPAICQQHSDTLRRIEKKIDAADHKANPQ